VGIYDRDYFRPAQPARSFPLPRSVVAALIAINIAVWIAELISGSQSWDLRDLLSAHVYTATDPCHWWHCDTLTHPWLWWQYLTAGFTHDPNDVKHILFNMLALFFLGPLVEQHYGSKEFLRLYLAMLVFSTVTWTVLAKLGGAADANYVIFGASGALAGIVVLLALNYPRLTVLFMFIIPMPMWLLGVLFVGMDMFGALGGRPDSNVAFTAHLAGAAFAAVYYWRHWNLASLTARLSWPPLPFHRKPRLRVHRPDTDVRPTPNLEQEVERILAKISREGQSSLTAKERATLEAASREYRRRQGKL
jgi:membrane associated rhomboid family serine protease